MTFHKFGVLIMFSMTLSEYLNTQLESCDLSETPCEQIPINKGYGFMTEIDSHKIKRGRLFLQKGNIYKRTSDGKHYELVEYLNETTQVVVRNIENSTTCIVNIDELENLTDENNEHINLDLSAIGDELWQKAQAKFEAIKPLLGTNRYNAQLIKARATQINVTERTLYRWLKAYNSVSSIAGLVDRKRGWQDGHSRLLPEQDKIIERVIREFYLTKQRTSMEQTYREVFRICSLENIEKPSKKAIRQRILQISQKEMLTKRGQKELANKRFKPTPFEFPNADYPLSVIQIDHTPVDLILVDDKYRKPIGRPFLTLAIDVYSRMITGYYLSLNAPSITSVAMCVARSILPKDKLLLEHGIDDGEWTCFGYPQKIHVDNAAEFQSNTFAQSCALHGINLEFRPIGKTHYGGHIERLMGTSMKEVHSIPGTTFSNIKERDTYQSEKEATMTLNEFETWLLTYITKIYHKRYHNGIGCSPEQQWRVGIFGDENKVGIGMPSLPADGKTLLLDFLPSFERTIQHFGVTIDGLTYYDTALNVFINQTDEKGNKHKFLFRRDPRDISQLWFYDPNLHQYFIVPFANQQLPSMSLWEYRAVRKRIEDKGDRYINENQIYQALTEMRELVENASKSTKRARRQEQRQKSHEKSQQLIAKTIANHSTDINVNKAQPSSEITSDTIKSNNSPNHADLTNDDFDFDLGEID